MASDEEKPATTVEEVRRAVLYITDALLVLTQAIDGVAMHDSLGGGLRGSIGMYLHESVQTAQQRLISATNLLVKSDGPHDGR